MEWVCPEEAPAGELGFASPAMKEEELEERLHLLDGLPVISRIRLADM